MVSVRGVRGTEMKHFLSYLGDDAALYEAALLNLFQS